MSMSIEKNIENYVNKAIKNKQAYRDNIQTAFEIFVAHYNTKLNHNSQPLLKILKATGKDIQYLKAYIYKATNITKMCLSDKGGLSLTFNGEFTYDNDFIDNNKWFDEANKADKKAINELDDKTLLRLINSLLKRVNDSSKLSINKDNLVRTLQPLSNQLKQAVGVSKQ